ncbi:MAG: MerR family transcriptional regulator [Propionibacteriaceae bacterium]
MEGWSTAAVADAAGYSVQQVRELERLGVIPPAERAPNGYRRFTTEHRTALRTYRRLAVAIGPVAARSTLRDLPTLPFDQAAAAVNALHTRLAAERDEALAARRALQLISAESRVGRDSVGAEDTLSITALATALGVRTSTLRFWEREGLLHPDRVTSHAARSYPPAAVREARITVALRAAGYRIPEVREALTAVRDLGEVDRPLVTLQHRLDSIARRTLALLTAGADLVALLDGPDPDS